METDPAIPEPPLSQRRKIIMAFIGALVMVLFIAGIGFVKKQQIASGMKANKAMPLSTETVTSLVIQPQSWESILQAVGSLSAAQGVMLSADSPGVVVKTPLASGTMVKKGDLLVQLDTRQEEAQLRSAEAKLTLAKTSLQRATELTSKNVIAKSTFDDAQAQYQAALAAVDETQATISRKTLRAPFDGMLGLCEINEGQYLNSGTPIVPLDLLDVISVSFFLPQHDFSDLKVGQTLRVKADGVPNAVFEGAITAINSELDPATRNIKVSGSINNDKMLLRGGMFVTVDVVLPAHKDVLAIPLSAISYAPYGDSIFIIETMNDPQGKSYLGVREQPVTLGATRGDQVEILTGLKAGDEVVTSGVFKLHAGSAVKINNSVQPGNNPAPQLENS